MSAAALLARGLSPEDLDAITLDPTNTGDATAWPWTGHVPWERIPPGERGATLRDVHDYARWKWATEHAGEKRWAAQVSRLWELTTTAEAARRAEHLVAEAEQERLATIEAERIADELRPAAAKGEAFTSKGRGKGAVKKAIRALLGRDVEMKNADIWIGLKALAEGKTKSPIKGYMFQDNHAGRYIEDPKGHNVMDFKSFQTRVSEVRRELKFTD